MFPLWFTGELVSVFILLWLASFLSLNQQLKQFNSIHHYKAITIIGTTGPLLAFLKVLHSTCVSRGIPFLPVYAWTGLWSAFFLLLSSVFSVSNIVEYLTQFTDDIFSALISIIFIFEAVVTLRNNFVNPAIPGIQATAALICALTTYSTATVLKKVRQTNLFPRKVIFNFLCISI